MGTEKNTTHTTKSHQTILKSYSHFSSKIDTFKEDSNKRMVDLECQIKHLKEMAQINQEKKMILRDKLLNKKRW